MGTGRISRKRSIVLCMFLFLSIAVFSQSQIVKLDLRNAQAREAFAQLKQQTDMHFVYEEKNVSRTATVTLSYARGEKLQTVLDALCRQLRLKYEIKGKVIMLFPAKKGGTHRLTLNVVDTDKQPMSMATCELKPAGLFVATDIDGNAVLDGVPEGEWMLTISYIGYNPIERRVNVEKDAVLNLVMQPLSLTLKGVEVVGRQNVSGTSTSSIINRQAIDHLQAYSLDDVMQLVPGQLMKNTNLTSKSNIQVRGLVNDNNNAFGSSVVVDGMPMSNNGAVSQGAFSSTAFVGTDLRNISVDDVESVEVIRGIPSAEYGDLTSGLVVVHSRIGVTPWQVKAKVNPGNQNYSIGKGLKMGRWGTLNFNADYAKAWGDPRMKTKSYDRYTFALGHGYNVSKAWHTTTKFRFVYSKDWNGNDPDAIDDGTFSKDIYRTMTLTHNGKLSINKPLVRTLNYTVGLNLTQSNSEKIAIVGNSTGLLPILTATETGYYMVPWMNTSYKAGGGTKSEPGNVYAKITDQFYVKAGKTHQSFKLGAEYHYDWNNARGYYNDNDQLPLRPNSDGRPRPFYDIPGLHQLNAFVEDNFRWTIGKHKVLKMQLGVRYTAIQMFKDEAASSLSPRINASMSLTKWLEVRGGYGLNSKTPSLNYLYPDKKYTDRVAANYMPQNNPEAQILAYHTNVYNVQRTLGLENATNRKAEIGFDVKLPGNRKLTVIAYRDKTKNGFGAATEYYTYLANFYSQKQGLIVTPGQATTIAWNNPERTDTVFSTTGKIGNNRVSQNSGIEMDFNLGEIKPLYTTLYLTGAYQESQSWSTDMNSQTPVNVPMAYKQYNTTPFKIVYPSALEKSVYRRFSTTVRLVTHIPALKMVASVAGQAIWYSYMRSVNPAKKPIGWIDTDLSYHEITQAMLADENYTIKGVKLKDQITNPKDDVPNKAPVTWNLTGRLTKELSGLGTLSFYANNLLFYEPFKSNSTSSTLSQYNTNNFSFGVELAVSL